MICSFATVVNDTRWCTLSCQYLREFAKKFEMILIGYSGPWGKQIHAKNLRSKISWHCPFKGWLLFLDWKFFICLPPVVSLFHWMPFHLLNACWVPVQKVEIFTNWKTCHISFIFFVFVWTFRNFITVSKEERILMFFVVHDEFLKKNFLRHVSTLFFFN